MKTLSQFAYERGVSEKTVRRRIAEVCKMNEGQVSDSESDKKRQVGHLTDKNLTSKIKGITYITSEGAKILELLLPNIKKESDSDRHKKGQVGQNLDESDTVGQTDGQYKSEEILFLREQVTSLYTELNKEREHSRKQTDELSKLAQQIVEITRNNQILLGAEQSRTNPALFTGKEENSEPQAPVNQDEDSLANQKQNKKIKFFNFFKHK